jgi:predicted ATP-grasp superfamily ATP-dependent carboligase
VPLAASLLRQRVRPSRAVGAVVVGGDYQGLGIARSLGRRGIPVCVVDDERSIARFSRYVVRSVRVSDLRDEAVAVDALLDLGDRLKLDGWVLFPTREETVAALSRHRDDLVQRYRVPTPAWDVVRHAWDKRATYELARALDIPTPRSWQPADTEAVKDIDGQPPFVLKPAIKEHFVYATKAKAWRADTRAELVERFTRASAIVGPGEVIVQELIPGDGQQQFAYCAFFKNGDVVGSMVARRARQHPPEFGRASTYVESVDVPEIEGLSQRFLKAIDYYGLVELEYKLDTRDGQYKLLDVNARTWGYHTLGGAAGVDFPYLLFADQLGLPTNACRGRSGVRWVRLVTDVPTAAVEIGRGNLGIRQYLRSLRGVHIESVFAREDPVPGLVELALIPYLAVRRGF